MDAERFTWLEEGIVLYDLLRQLYLRPPTPEALGLVRGLELDAAAVPEALHEGFRLLKRASADEAILPALGAEYTRLFLGPGQVPVPPFESCYRTGGGLVMQEVTTQVRQAYLAESYLAKRRAFLEDHLLRWAPQFCERLLAATGEPFFKGLACFTRGVLEIAAQDLAEGS
jgi:TorA maturation chaperone TorD